jgi:EAL and modified HD-GYP domain-containing signal transduction protein
VPDVNATAPATSSPQGARRDVAVARQPVCDAALAVVGYELLVDAEGTANPAGLIIDAFAEIGLDELVGDRPAHVDVTPGFLVEVHPPPLRPDRVVLELPATTPAGDALRDVLRRLRSFGFTVALDRWRADTATPGLLELAGMAKIEVAGRDDAELAADLRALRPHGTLALALGVDTRDELRRCIELGFERFQGGVYATPALMHGREVPTNGLTALRSVADLSTSADFEALERLIVEDIGLSYKLLRYVNSAFFSLPRQIESIREALVMLGERTVKRWATVMALADVEGRPDELVTLALQRARMAELLAGDAGEVERHAHFTVGLFSVVDALLDAPMGDVLASLPFGPELREALVERRGPKGEVLEAIVCFERGEFARAEVSRPGAPPIAEAYRQALAWAREASSPIG